MVALVTPMHSDGSIDFTSLDKVVEFHVTAGTDAIIAVGTTGESATLDQEEHCAVVQHVVEKVSGRLPVIAGTGSNSTTEAIELGNCAIKSGADACLVVTPYYNKPTQLGLFEHYRVLAEKVDLPMILYNVPGRTAVDMQPETVQKLSNIKNIVGIKEASGSLERIATLVSLCDKDFVVLSGDDDLALEAIGVGARGVISVTANVAPDCMHGVFSEALAGNMAQAKDLNSKLTGLHESLFIEANPIPVKWALYEMGLIENGIRLPMTTLSETYHSKLRQAMKQANLL